MTPQDRGDTARSVRADALPLREVADLDPLLNRIGDARYVLVGEASHGTSDFYRWRTELTRRLISERDFSFVAVEGDWPDCHRLHRWVTGDPEMPASSEDVLWGFDRWPRWMWANEEVAEFARWLREFNATQFSDTLVGFHGLDVYSLWDSLHAVVGYLREYEPAYVETALAAARCFEPYHEQPQKYAFATTLVPESCRDEVVELLTQLRRGDEAALPGVDPEFVARQNAEVVAGAERYYREMMRGDRRSWNVRDQHMTDTLDRLIQAYGPASKAVVWAHNTHVGDARATDMAAAELINVGQLVRERHSDDGVVAIGFGTHHGTTIAGERWGARPRRMTVPEARDGSVEDLLHGAVPGTDSLFLLTENREPEWAREVRGHRAIGVVYAPGGDRIGNYVPTQLSHRYDAFVYCDDSAALHPLHPLEHEPEPAEAETYPSGQ